MPSLRPIVLDRGDRAQLSLAQTRNGTAVEAKGSDQAIGLRFLSTYEAAANGELAAWEESVEGALALVLLLISSRTTRFAATARLCD
jgi:uncharacterized protein (DUF924 family)